MKRFPPFAALVLLLVIVSFHFNDSARAQDVKMIVLAKIFRIIYGNEFGSSFTIEVDGRQYLITAKHVTEGIRDGDLIKLFSGEKTPRTLTVKAIYPDHDVDIVALALPQLVGPPGSIIPTSSGVVLGQDVYSFGFPSGLAVLRGRWPPAPFVKRGALSAIAKPFIFIDGTNNLGFSGGPVFFVDLKTRELKFGGVISRIRYAYADVLKKYDNDSRRIDEIPPTQLEATGEFVPANPGIVIASIIDPIIEAIKKRPIGAPMK